jgi:hypothetical protein
MTKWIVCGLIFSIVAVFGDDEVSVFEVAQIEKIVAAEGEVVTVRGLVEKTGKSGGTGMNFLNFPGGEFSAVVFAKSLKAFPAGEPADLLEGKLIEVTGKVQFYDKKPQIVVEKPGQIVVLDPKTRKPFPVEVKVAPEPKDEKKEPDAPVAEPEKVEPDKDKVDPRLYFDDP